MLVLVSYVIIVIFLAIGNPNPVIAKLNLMVFFLLFRFVLSLVTANILISSIIAPLLLFETVLNDYFLLPCISDLISTVSSSVIFSAVFSTFLIATDRFYAVTSPLHYSMTITRSRSQVMIMVAWLSGICLALPYILLCTITNHSSTLQRSLHIIFTVAQTVIGYFFPFVGLCWLYLRMYHAAHRNSERTRKHSISGELLTVMDGSTSVIPQGIDFLTHYMNPFTRAPMAGSVQPTLANGGQHGQENRNSIGQVMPIVVKKSRRRSSNGSSSSLLFREEGRAIKTAFFVLASFFVCWTPHFALMLINEVFSGSTGDSAQTQQQVGCENTTESMLSSPAPEELIGGEEAQSRSYNHNGSFSGFGNSGTNTPAYGSDWARFLGVFGMLLSSVLNPFIYVFRNKIACEEISRLLYSLFGLKVNSKEDQIYNNQHSMHAKDRERKGSDNNGGGTGATMPVCSNPDTLPACQDVVDYQPRYSPCIGKSPKRSSMKSLTPQSSINSTITNCNSMNGGAGAESPSVASRAHSESAHYNHHHGHHHITFSNGRPSKPPFMRSLTLPEQQTQPRVKFPANLTRQKSYASYRPGPASHPHPSSGPSSTEITPAISKRSKFVRQDSVCSILSNDSVLMICSEDGMEMGPLGILNLGLAAAAANQTPGTGLVALNTGIISNRVVQPSTITRVPEGDSEEEACPSKICCNNATTSIQGTPVAKCYLRQDSNFSDASHRTNDSGVVLSSTCSRHGDASTQNSSISATPERCCRPVSSPALQQQHHTPQVQHPCKSRDANYLGGHTQIHHNTCSSSSRKPTCPIQNPVSVLNNNPKHTIHHGTSPRNSPILLQTSI